MGPHHTTIDSNVQNSRTGSQAEPRNEGNCSRHFALSEFNTYSVTRTTYSFLSLATA